MSVDLGPRANTNTPTLPLHDRIVLWTALTPPDLAVNALQRFRGEVAEANRRFEEATRSAPGATRDA